MMRNINKILAIAIAIAMMCSWVVVANAENNILYVCVDEGSYLKGRYAPRKNADVVVRLYPGEAVEVVDIIDGWVEIVNGVDTVFVDCRYVSETDEPYKMINTSGGRVRVRDSIDGKVVDYVKAKGVVTIERTILGWGYTGHGWVKLSYFDSYDGFARE